MFKNKRGQGLSTNAIILIVLGVIVLVILAVGFMAGWDKIAPWIKPSNNVKEVVQACGLACTSESTYDYCSLKRTLIASDLPGGVNEIENTCQFFSNETGYELYGIAECPGLCPQTESQAES